MNLFSFIKEHVTLLDVVNEYTRLKKMGIYWKGMCPFHQEKDASFTVSVEKAVYYCFGCHAGGDVISFIAQAENCSPLEAAHHLADRYNIEIPAEIAAPQQQKMEQVRGHAHLCQAVALWCHEQLFKTAAALDYVQKRGLTPNTCKKHIIGYLPAMPTCLQIFIQAMQQKNILVKDLVEVGFLCEGKGGLYSPFEERILFPIRDHLGRFCGFGGRIFKKDDTRAKYYNSRDNPSFNKGSLLFGLDQSKKAIQKAGSVFLVEGYMDYVMMDQQGYQNTVATLGTACTVEHLTTVARYAQIVHVLYDGDNAGQQAILRLAQLCWHCSLELRVVRLPSSEDPASWLLKNGNLDQFVAHAQDIFSFFIENTGEHFSSKTLQEKIKRAQKIIDLVKQVDSSLKRDLILQEAAQKFDIPIASLQRECRLTSHRPSVAPVCPSDPVSVASTTKPETGLEKKLFFAIMNNIQDEIHDEEYFCEPLRGILMKLRHEKESQNAANFNAFFGVLTPQEQNIVSRIMVECGGSPEPVNVQKLREQFRKKNWKNTVHDLVLQLEQAKKDGNETKIRQLLEQFTELKKRCHIRAQ